MKALLGIIPAEYSMIQCCNGCEDANPQTDRFHFVVKVESVDPFCWDRPCDMVDSYAGQAEILGLTVRAMAESLSADLVNANGNVLVDRL
jgi:hypothetical protein